jgi:hypothetical protein
MEKRMKRALVVAFLLVAPGWATADVWDVTPHDNDNTTKNELVHGSEQLHDLAGTGDMDWYQIRQQAYASYEVVTDGTSGQIGATLSLSRVNLAGTILSSAASVGSARTLRFMNATTSVIPDQFVLVSSTSCGTCGANAGYRVRAFETTYAIPRFNNNGTQTTVVLIQNPTTEAVNVVVYFWSASGSATPLATYTKTIQPKNTDVIHAASYVPAGSSGAITIISDAPYGRLAGKAVAMEPATGFSFDAFMTPIPH